jgi:hypothetical protein
MAKIPPINLSSSFNTFRTSFNKLVDSVGDLATLTTDTDSDVVKAINSIDSNLGTRTSLTTSNADVVTAINELDAELGTITSGAMGTTASTVSGAIAELDGRLDSINNTQLNTSQIRATDVDIANTLEVDGFFTARGGVILGNTSGDLIYPYGSFNLDVIPATDSAYALGSATKRWKSVYTQNLSADSGTITGNLNVQGVLTTSAGRIVDSAVIQGIVDSNFADSNEIAKIANRSIANSQLANNTITLNGVTVALGGTDVIDTTDSGIQTALIKSTMKAVDATGILYDSSRAEYSLSSIPNSSLLNSTIVINGVTYTLGDDSAVLDITDSAIVTTLARNAISVTGSTGLSYTSSTGVLAGVNATTATKGVASFNSASFSTSSGAISIKSGGVSNAQLANSTFSVNGVSGSLGADITVDVTDSAAIQGIITSNFGAMPATITRSGNFTIDASGDITLDADGNDIFFKNGAGGDTVTHNLSDAAAYTITSPGTMELVGSTITLDASTSVTLETASNGSIYFADGTNTIEVDLTNNDTKITSTDALTVSADGSFNDLTLEGQNVNVNARIGQVFFKDNDTHRCYFDVNTATTLKLYTYDGVTATLNSTFSGADLTVEGDITSVSDIRTKENIETITNGLDIIDSLRGVYYNKIGEDDRNVGVIAQEVEEVLPEVVKTDADGMKSVDYGKMVGVLIEAIKDLKTELDQLKNGG